MGGLLARANEYLKEDHDEDFDYQNCKIFAIGVRIFECMNMIFIRFTKKNSYFPLLRENHVDLD